MIWSRSASRTATYLYRLLATLRCALSGMARIAAQICER
jgi:hypothetical protein